jgi:hypothetical protein
MDVTREQSQPAQAPTSPEQYAPPPPAAADAPSAAYSRLEVGDRLARILFRRSLRLLLTGWYAIRPQLAWVVLTTILVGIITVLGMALALPRLLRNAGRDTGDARVALIQPADAVEDFLRAQQTFDADLMWQSFSPELRASLENQAITRDALADYVENERQAGQRYRSFEYVGGVPLDGRQTMYFYVVDVESPEPERSGMISFIFTVNSAGKIISVRT